MKLSSVVQYRQDRPSEDVALGKYGIPVGWFRTTENLCGWTIYNLDTCDLAWFESQKEDIDRVYRVVSHNNHTSLVKFTKKMGTVYFFDNAFYESTDLIAFEIQGVKVAALYLD